jgi:hypothetical protein
MTGERGGSHLAHRPAQGRSAGQGGKQNRALGFHRLGLVRLVHQVQKGSARHAGVSGLRRQKCRSGETGLPEQNSPDRRVESRQRRAERHKIHGFPTLVGLDKNGKEIGRQVGCFEGGPQSFIAKLEGFKAAK